MNEYKTRTGKTIRLPARMLRLKELEDMGHEFVEESILLNVTTTRGKRDEPSPKARENMALVEYIDCSQTHFERNTLIEKVQTQLKAKPDFLWLPAFKDETSHDVREKIQIAKKLREITDIDIVLEVFWRLDMHIQDIIDTDAYDALSIVYGSHYGHFNSLNLMVMRAGEYRAITKGPVFFNAVPIKYSGDSVKDVRFLPASPLIADAWSKAWRPAPPSPNSPEKLLDETDLKCKTEPEWMVSRNPNYKIPTVDMTIYEVFKQENKAARDLHDRMVMDEIYSGIVDVDAGLIEEVINKMHTQYQGLVITGHRQKEVISLLWHDEAFNQMNVDDKMSLQRFFLRYISPIQFHAALDMAAKAVHEQGIIDAGQIISILEQQS